MKKLFYSVILLFIYEKSISQNETVTGKSYITTVDNVVVYGVGSDGKIDKNQRFKVNKGTKFNANGLDEENNVKITFWPYSKPSGDTASKPRYKSDFSKNFSNVYETNHEFIGYWANYKDFVIELPTFNIGTKLYYGKDNDFTWGVLTLPIKARLGNKKDRYFDIEENLNLGFSFGLRHQIESVRKQAINYLAGVSIARVKTDSISIKNSFKAPESSVASALMFSGGILYQYEDAFQVGIFLGVDNVMGELGRNWKFQSKPWIGFAIGISLFSKNGSQSGEGSNSPEKVKQ